MSTAENFTQSAKGSHLSANVLASPVYWVHTNWKSSDYIAWFFFNVSAGSNVSALECNPNYNIT